MTRAEPCYAPLEGNRLAGFGFRRKSPMGNYIADFVSHASKLVVEVDGENHDFESVSPATGCETAGLLLADTARFRFTNDDVRKISRRGDRPWSGSGESRTPSLTLPARGEGTSRRCVAHGPCC